MLKQKLEYIVKVKLIPYTNAQIRCCRINIFSEQQIVFYDTLKNTKSHQN